jgi:hypothetical protein
MVMTVGFDNLKIFGQILYPAFGDRSHHQALRVDLAQHMPRAAKISLPYNWSWGPTILAARYKQSRAGDVHIKRDAVAENSDILDEGIKKMSKTTSLPHLHVACASPTLKHAQTTVGDSHFEVNRFTVHCFRIQLGVKVIHI